MMIMHLWITFQCCFWYISLTYWIRCTCFELTGMLSFHLVILTGFVQDVHDIDRWHSDWRCWWSIAGTWSWCKFFSRCHYSYSFYIFYRSNVILATFRIWHGFWVLLPCNKLDEYGEHTLHFDSSPTLCICSSLLKAFFFLF